MHPQLKTDYMRDNGWPPEWIETAVDFMRCNWQENYKPLLPPVVEKDEEVCTINFIIHKCINNSLHFLV